MTGVGMVVDGIHLYESYKQSLVEGSYNPLFNQAGRVAGGWTGAVLESVTDEERNRYNPFNHY